MRHNEDKGITVGEIGAQRAYAVRVGREEGRKQGREEGREEGFEEAKVSIAKKLFEAGTPIDVIISCTGIDQATAATLAERS